MVSKNPSSLGIPLVIIFLTSLWLLPQVVTPKKIQLKSLPSNSTAMPTMPMDLEFRVLEGGSTKRTATLRSIAQKAPGGLLVNFWATWCAPCIEELPSLEMLARHLQKYPSKLPQLVAIAEDEKSDDVIQFLKRQEYRSAVLVVHDTSGMAAKAVSTEKFPETYLISQEGKILYKWIGPQDWLSNDVLSILAQSK